MTNLTFESELNGPTPRPVRYRDGWNAGCGLWCVRLFTLPHTIVGITVLCIAIASTGQFAAVGLLGKSYEGKIVKKDDSRSTKGTRHYYVQYTYDVDGRGYRGEVKVTKDRFDEMREGDAITVRAWDVMPDSGQWPRVPGHLPIEDLGGKWFFAVFWNGLMSVFLWMVYVRPWRQRQLVRIGIPTQGIIRDVNTYTNKGTKNYVLKYEYAVPATEEQPGQVLHGRLTSTVKAAAGANRGDVVTVLYHPQKPRRSLLYAYSDYRATTEN
jgi:hypothetical protein